MNKTICGFRAARIRNSSLWRVQLVTVAQNKNQTKAEHVHDVGG